MSGVVWGVCPLGWGPARQAGSAGRRGGRGRWWVVMVRPRAVVMVNSPSLGESPGPGWWSWGVGVMCQPVRWMMPWCRRHNRTRLVTHR